VKGNEVDNFYKELADMSWNYRVIETHSGYEIREVYYRKGEPEATTQGTAGCWGQSLEELKQDLKLIEEALNKPVLKEEIFDAEGGDF